MGERERETAQGGADSDEERSDETEEETQRAGRSWLSVVAATADADAVSMTNAAFTHFKDAVERRRRLGQVNGVTIEH